MSRRHGKKGMFAEPNRVRRPGRKLSFDRLEDRTTPTISATLTAGVVVFTSNESDSITFSVDPNGRLRHDQPNGNFASDIDLDTATPGVQSATLGTITSFTYNGGSGSDTVSIDFSSGNPLPMSGFAYNGGSQSTAPGDVLKILGSPGLTATYLPNGTTVGSGTATLSGNATGVIAFTGIEPIDFLGVPTVNLNFPNSYDAMTIADGLIGTNAALVVGGSSGSATGPVDFSMARLRNVAAVNIDTTEVDGNDTITIAGGTSAHGIGGLSIATGTGFDAIQFNGNLSIDGDFNLSGVDGVVLGASVVLDTEQGNDGDGGAVDFGGAPVRSFVAGRDLTIHTNTSAAGASGGAVTLGPAIATAAPLYFDDMSGINTAPLNGATPDITLGGNTWVSNTLTPGQFWNADGSVNIASNNPNAFLPFTPASGHVYALSADVNVTSMGDSWIALGFTEFLSVSNGAHAFSTSAVNPAPWMFSRGDGAPTDAGLVTHFGPATPPGSFQVVGSSTTAVSHNLKVQLDTTNANWTATWFVDNTPVRTHSYSTNPTINFVGIGALNGVTGKLKNFTLSDFSASPTVALNDIIVDASAGGSSPGAVALNGNVSLDAAGTLNVVGNANVGAAVISTVNGNLSFDGPLHLMGSIISTSGTGSIVLGGDVTVAGSLASSLSGKIDLGDANRTFHVNDATASVAVDLAVSAVVSNGSLTKTGGGTIDLAGPSDYEGNTVVAAGVLLANNLSVSSTGSGQVTVQSSASLGGSGKVGGQVQVDDGGFIAPGNSPGTIGTGDLTLKAGSTLNEEIASAVSYDVINVTGTVTLGTLSSQPRLNVFLTGGYVPEPGEPFTIIANNDGDAVTGRFKDFNTPFSVLNEGDIFTADGNRFSISYVGGTGNDVVLTCANIPVVTGVTPFVGPTTGGFAVVITGSAFKNATTVTFGSTNVAIPSNLSNTTIVCMAPNIGAAATYNVTVTNAYGTSTPVSLAPGVDQVKYVSATLVNNGPSPSVIGQSVGFTLNLSSAVPASTTFDLRDASAGNAIVGSLTVANGASSGNASISSLSVGGHSIFADYDGVATPSVAALQSNAVAQTVSPTKLTDVAIDDDSGQRSIIRLITLTFDGIISAASAGAVTITDQDDNAIADLTVNVAGTGTSALTLTFTDADPDDNTGPVVYDSLEDGLYRLKVDGSLLTSQGYTVDADANGTVGGVSTTDFSRLFGDYTGNAFVDATDLYPYLVNSIDKGVGDSGYQRAFDYTGNDFVDATDIYPEIVSRIDTGL